MFGHLQPDVSANSKVDAFTKRVAGHHITSALHSSHHVVDAVDGSSAFGAFDASFDDDMELRLFEYLYDAGSRQTGTDDASTGTNASNNENTTGSDSTPSGSTSRTLAQTALPSPRPFDSPVESCYWDNLGLTPPVRVSSSQTTVEDRDARVSSSSAVAEPVPSLARGDLALGELQVTEEHPFIALPIPSTEDPQGDMDENKEEVVPEEEFHLSPATVSNSNSSGSTRAVSTSCPPTPWGEPCELGGDVLGLAETSRSIPDPPTFRNGRSQAHSPGDDKTSRPEHVSEDESHEILDTLEASCPSSNNEAAETEVTLSASSPSQKLVEMAPEESAPTPKEEPAFTELTSGALSRSLSQSPGVQGSDALPDPEGPRPRKRMRVGKAHAEPELRALSTLPSERKVFSLPVRVGRVSKTGKCKSQTIQVEAESCCHLAGENGRCQFPSLEGGGKCMLELPKDDKTARAHIALHTDALGWREYSKSHPDWEPTCHWCGKPRTKSGQLTRHILDTHLLMFRAWCPCGGTYSRSNQTNDTGRHEFSAKHKRYLKQHPKKAIVIREEETDDEQEFAQGSSKGTKRKRRR
ncbi:hypothetical protein ACEPAH_7798 [Sanghuangporus vaninii]